MIAVAKNCVSVIFSESSWILLLHSKHCARYQIFTFVDAMEGRSVKTCKLSVVDTA